MVYVSTSRGLAFDHRPSVQSVPLGLFYPETKAHDCLWLWRSEEGAWPLLSGSVVWFVRMCGWVVIDLVLRWRDWGWVARPTSVLWEGLRCSLLAPDSPSDSLTGWAVAQVPEICSARSWGTQSTCLEPCLWSPGPQTQPFASLEGLWTLWDETTAESLGVYIWNVGVVFFYCEKNLRLNTEGVLTKRTDGSSEPLDDFHCDLGHLDSVLLLSCLDGVQS